MIHLAVQVGPQVSCISFFLTSSVQLSSVAQSCPTLCDPMIHSTPGLPVHHQLPQLTQTHIHRVGDPHFLYLINLQLLNNILSLLQ